MDVGTGVELEYSYGAGDGRTRSGVASMPKERSGGPRLDWSCDWEKYGYDTPQMILLADYLPSPSLMMAPVRAPLPASYGIPMQSFNQLAQAPMLSQALSNPFQSLMSLMSSATSKLVS